jgi:hypothetical protein
MEAKTPKQLREQAEARAKKPTKPKRTRTAEGAEVSHTTRRELFASLRKLSNR